MISLEELVENVKGYADTGNVEKMHEAILNVYDSARENGVRVDEDKLRAIAFQGYLNGMSVNSKNSGKTSGDIGMTLQIKEEYAETVWGYKFKMDLLDKKFNKTVEEVVSMSPREAAEILGYAKT